MVPAARTGNRADPTFPVGAAGQGTPVFTPTTGPRSGERGRTSQFRDGARLGTVLIRGSDAPGRDRRPLGSSPGGARHSPPQAGGREEPRVRERFASRPGPRRSASSGRLPGIRLSLRFAQRCRPPPGETPMIGSARSPCPHDKGDAVLTLAGLGVIAAGFALPRVPTGGRRSKPSPRFCPMGDTQFRGPHPVRPSQSLPPYRTRRCAVPPSAPCRDPLRPPPPLAPTPRCCP